MSENKNLEKMIEKQKKNEEQQMEDIRMLETSLDFAHRTISELVEMHRELDKRIIALEPKRSFCFTVGAELKLAIKTENEIREEYRESFINDEVENIPEEVCDRHEDAWLEMKYKELPIADLLDKIVKMHGKKGSWAEMKRGGK